MRRILPVIAVLGLCLEPSVASAKLPFFDLKVDPLDPEVGERITLTMTCFEDAVHTRPVSTCFGVWDRMAWVHPLDDEGRLDRRDWILVEGRPTSSGATRGTIVLDEPGSYDVLPLWRTWEDHPSGGRFPGVIRVEVGEPPRIVAMAGAALTAVGIAIAVIAWRRRAATDRHHLTVDGSQFAPEASTHTRSPASGR
jgi:hypothetical protein